MTAAALAAHVGGSLVGDADATFSGFAIDSRVLSPGECFVALKDTRDGHDFVADAFDRGAPVALVARTVDGAGERTLVVVDDPLLALGRAAASVRDSWSHHLTVVGITGSAGKTSTKDLTAAALSTSRRVHASPGSFNNEAGLPLTILSARSDAEVVVAELGARFPGNIAELCAIARPDVGLVTHIGSAHAEHLGGREGIISTKGALLEALPAAGVAVLNADDDATPRLATRTRAQVLTVGAGPGADVVVREIEVGDDLRTRLVLDSPWGALETTLSMRGSHQAINAAMAATVALALGGTPEDVATGLSGATTARWRMELVVSSDGVTVLNDAYNASPTSMRAALHSLGRLPAQRRVAVVGDMLELGAEAPAAHAEIGALAAAVGVELLVAVGAHAAVVAAHAARAGIVALTAADPAEAGALVAAHVRPGDAVLVKASRAVGLEVVADRLSGGARP